jgi:hypothetical protein
MAFSAEFRNSCTVNRGGIIIPGFGTMGAVAICAIGSIFHLIIMGLAMTTLKIVIEYLGVTCGAIHRNVG